MLDDSIQDSDMLEFFSCMCLLWLPMLWIPILNQELRSLLTDDEGNIMPRQARISYPRPVHMCSDKKILAFCQAFLFRSTYMDFACQAGGPHGNSQVSQSNASYCTGSQFPILMPVTITIVLNLTR